MTRKTEGPAGSMNTASWQLKTTRSGRVRIVLTLWLSFLLTVPAALAQFNAGVQGSVQDSSGAAISGATLTLTNLDTKISQTAKSDASGVFQFASLGPGSYTVSALAQGFSEAATEFKLTAGETRNVPVTLS